MRETFKSLGYDMPKLLGTEVSENQIIEIKNRKEDLSIPAGKVIISKIIKPQVLFNNKMVPGVKLIVDVIQNTEN